MDIHFGCRRARPVERPVRRRDRNTSALPGSADGFQDTFILIGPSQTPGVGYLSVTGLATVESGTRYRLVVAVGNRLDAAPGAVTLALTVNGSVVVSNVVVPGAVPDGTFTDFDVSFVTQPVADASVGGSLGILMSMTGSTTDTLKANLNNVRLSASPVPESSSAWVISAGLAGIAWKCRRSGPPRRRVPSRGAV
ncbi:MAG: hypothetical protein GC151_06995 [Betaproteobacteria bacterium]|nr:hypothetical protein [Betaproteobacteria bacterium]